MNFVLPLSLLNVTPNGTVYELYDAVTAIRQAGEVADRTPQTTRYFDPYVFTVNDRGKAATPRLDILDMFMPRTFRWTAGKSRTSSNGESLAPVYNAVPYPVGILASVSIRFSD